MLLEHLLGVMILLLVCISGATLRYEITTAIMKFLCELHQILSI